jgi:hypothetical protein
MRESSVALILNSCSRVQVASCREGEPSPCFILLDVFDPDHLNAEGIID